MKKQRWIVPILMAAAIMAAGCGTKEEAAEITPTPEPTAAPTATPTPKPTATPTPAPKVIGEKTSTAKSVAITNSTNAEIREIYLRTSGTEEWGNNLVPAENSVKAKEVMQMYYTPAAQEGETTPDYDMKWVDKDGNAYELLYLQLGDMEKASLVLEEQTSYLKYQSISQKKEITSKEITEQKQAEAQAAAEAAAAEAQAAEAAAAQDSGSYDSGYSDGGYYDNGGDYSGDYSSDGGYDSSGDDSGSYSGDYSGDYGGDYSDGGGETGSGTDDGCADMDGDIIWNDDGSWSVQ